MLTNYLNSIKKRDPSARSNLSILLTYPGVKALYFHRVANFFCKAKFYLVARIVSQLSRFFTGIEIHPNATIGNNFFIDHGMGVVIGETSDIGDNVTIYHAVTLGGISPSIKSEEQRNVKRHPTLKNNVIVGSGAQILGPITVGENAKIGANAVVINNVPDNAVMIGVPARNINPESRVDTAFKPYGIIKDKKDNLDK
jgi:serine O-acetyltransferase